MRSFAAQILFTATNMIVIKDMNSKKYTFI